MKDKKIIEHIGSPRYDRWLHEDVLDFGDYSFTRAELNDMGIGMHCVAAKRLHRVIHEQLTPSSRRLHNLYKIGMKAVHHLDGVGETSLIVLAYCIAAASENYDVLKWMGGGRTIRGGVRANKDKR